MQKWVKAEAHQSLVLGYCIHILLQPCSSNIWAHGAVWSLSGILFLWKCNSKLTGACAKWRNSVVPACGGGAAKQGASEGSVVYFPSISSASLPCDLKRGPFLEYYVTYPLPCNSKSPKTQFKNAKQFSSTSLIKSNQQMVNAGCSFICLSSCERLLLYFWKW